MFSAGMGVGDLARKGTEITYDRRPPASGSHRAASCESRSARLPSAHCRRAPLGDGGAVRSYGWIDEPATDSFSGFARVNVIRCCAMIPVSRSAC